MVNAGVYLVVRAQPIYRMAPDAMLAMGVVGGASALYAATVSLVQTDVKGRLIFSTKAQLGLMFLACGFGAHAMAIVHMVAHSILRCHDFLSAPSVIQQMRGRKAHRKVGSASRPRVPLLARLLLFGAIGILLAPVMSEGWHSLEHSPVRGTNVLYALCALAVFFVFHYTRRLVLRMLARAARVPATPLVATVEPPLAGGFPWLPLGALGGFGALLFALPIWLDFGRMHASLAHVLSSGPPAVQAAPLLSIVALALLLALILAGWLIALYFQNDQPDSPGSALFRLRKLYVAALHRFWLDEIYARAIVAPARRLGLALERIDSDVIDRAAGVLRRKIGQRTSPPVWQTDILAPAGRSTETSADVPPPSATPVPSARGVAGRLMTWSSVFMHQVERQVITGGIGHGIPMAGSLLGRTLNHVETFLGKPLVKGTIVLSCLGTIVIYSLIHSP
jgi:NADH-quinone oxidoreductase subunit L